MAPRTKKASAPSLTSSGRGWPCGSRERSRSQAKKRTKGRRTRILLVADAPRQDRVARLQGIEHGALRDRPTNLEHHLPFHLARVCR